MRAEVAKAHLGAMHPKARSSSNGHHPGGGKAMAATKEPLVRRSTKCPSKAMITVLQQCQLHPWRTLVLEAKADDPNQTTANLPPHHHRHNHNHNHLSSGRHGPPAIGGGMPQGPAMPGGLAQWETAANRSGEIGSVGKCVRAARCPWGAWTPRP